MNKENISYIRSNLKKTHFVNMMPQRGFLTSEQSFVTVIDIDLTYESDFILKIFKEDGIMHFFIKNGPLKINPYQKNFTIEIEDKDSMEFIDNCNFYEVTGGYILDNNIKSYAKSDYETKKIDCFEKEKNGNIFTFKIKPEYIDFLEKTNFLLFAHPQEIDLMYNAKLYIENNISIKKYNIEGYDSILLYIEETFKKLKLSGKLYKTKNGLRIILTDKFRDISKKENIKSIIDIMNEFMMDSSLVSLYLLEDGIKHYLTRLTPKLKNYKYFDNSYELILKNLENFTLESLRLEKNIIPVKYDFNKIEYANNNTNQFLDYSFNILKEMIFNYLKNDSYAVCSLLKTYNYGPKNEIIDEFVQYHDKWTKANLKNTILV